MDSELLAGGLANAGAVRREGDVVHRPAPANAAVLHRLLAHLGAAGFGAPRPIALNGDVETVGFIPGDVALPPFPAWSMTDGVLRAIGAFIRRYHDTVAGFSIPAWATWSSELADPHGGPIVCHNDVCPENVVFRDEEPIALLDFDFAAPGRPVWDVAQAAGYWCPITDPALATALRRPPFDPVRRLASFIDAYGLSDDDRQVFVDVYIEMEEVSVEFVRRQIESGHQQFAELWASGGRERFARKMAWIGEHRPALERAVRR